MLDPGWSGLGAKILPLPPWAATTLAPSQKTLPDVVADFRCASVMSVKRGGDAAGRTRNRSYALGDPFAHVPSVDRSQDPPLQSPVTPQESPGVLPPTHVPPSTSEMKPRPCPISWRTTLTKSV